jgi:S1-C subfamily serine protease
VPGVVRGHAPWLWLVAALAVAAPVASAQPSALDAQAVFALASPAVAVIRVVTNGSSGLGTGFVVDPRGVLATAAHVARRTDSIAADFGDGHVLDAELVGYDARRDLALLRVQPRERLPALEVVDASAVHPGDPVVVIGTPRGRPRVMTTGNVRGTGVTLPGQAPGIFILFDAEIEPGNSGGPLLDAGGRVIGVVVARIGAGGGGGLAVSGTALRESMPALAAGARIERPWIGIAGMTVPQDPALPRGIPAPRGVLVVEVLPGSPARTAGLRGLNSDGPPGDIIISIDGQPVDDWEDLLRALGARQPGDRIHLSVVRAGLRLDVSLTLEARPE